MLYWFKCCLNRFFFLASQTSGTKRKTLLPHLHYSVSSNDWRGAHAGISSSWQWGSSWYTDSFYCRCRWRLKIRSQGDKRCQRTFTSSLFDVWRLFVLLADVCRLDGRPSRPAVHPCNPRCVLVRYQNHLSWFPLIGGAPLSVLRPHFLQRKPSCRFTITNRSK